MFPREVNRQARDLLYRSQLWVGQNPARYLIDWYARAQPVIRIGLQKYLLDRFPWPQPHSTPRVYLSEQGGYWQAQGPMGPLCPQTNSAYIAYKAAMQAVRPGEGYDLPVFHKGRYRPLSSFHAGVDAIRRMEFESLQAEPEWRKYLLSSSVDSIPDLVAWYRPDAPALRVQVPTKTGQKEDFYFFFHEEANSGFAPELGDGFGEMMVYRGGSYGPLLSPKNRYVLTDYLAPMLAAMQPRLLMEYAVGDKVKFDKAKTAKLDVGTGTIERIVIDAGVISALVRGGGKTETIPLVDLTPLKRKKE